MSVTSIAIGVWFGSGVAIANWRARYFIGRFTDEQILVTILFGPLWFLAHCINRWGWRSRGRG